MCLALVPNAFAADYTEVVPCKYNRVGNFSEGMAAVCIGKYPDEKWGFIDKTGKEVVPCKYFYPSSPLSTDQNPRFSEGLARVCVSDENRSKSANYWGKYGFIDQTGKEVIPIQYDTAGDFSEGLAMVGVKNGRGTSTYIGFEYDFDCGFIDKTGKEVIPLQYSSAESFSEGLAAVQGENGKWGYIDQTGKVVIPFKYGGAEPFSEGLAAVKDENGKWGFIDKTGKEVVPCIYFYVKDFSEGLAAVKDENDIYGFIDQTGKVVIPFKYGSTEPFSEGLAAVAHELRDSYIDKTGKEAMPAPYNILGSFSEGFAAVNYGGKYGYIDKTGKEVVPCQYAWASSVSEGMAAVATVASVDAHNNKTFQWGFLSFDGASAPEQPASGPQVSDWAKEQVNKAAENGLVPDSLGNDYRANITRAQFAATAVKLYEAMSGQKAPAAGESPFTDTSDTAVIQAQALGIVSGVGDGKFSPDALVTREQAAAMLSRVYTKLGGNIPKVADTTFADNDKVSGWARDAVAFMADKGIVSGVGNNQFAPQGNASIEQALVIALRMFDNLK